MYHQLMLYRVLDCYNLVRNNNHFGQELLNIFRQKVPMMLGWLQQMTFSNGDIPLLNDSAFNINPSTKSLTEYANTLGITAQKLSLKQSGYRKIVKDAYELIIDIGAYWTRLYSRDMLIMIFLIFYSIQRNNRLL